MRTTRPTCCWLLAALPLAPLLASRATAEAPEPLTVSPRNAGYTIEARLDPDARTLEGRLILDWRNLQQSPTGELRFHLYWNAWRNNRSTWMLGDTIRARRRVVKEPREDDWGWMEVDTVRLLEGQQSIDLAWRYDSPDDGNPDDRTVMVAELPTPVGPDETLRIELTWRSRIPRSFARTGVVGDHYFMAHWFPKLGVYEAGGWNCHQFHVGTEFFSDYGIYDVRMTVPEGWIVAATGLEQAQWPNGDGTVTHHYREEDVHAFTWTTSPHYIVRTRRFEAAGLPPVDMRLLIQPEHLGQAERHFTAVEAAIELFGRGFGPYPYGHLTIVDPAYHADFGGMEYPTLFTSRTRRFNPFGDDEPERPLVHETGHQFWYGIVGNDEFEHAWLDEGLNVYSTIHAMDATFGRKILSRRYLDFFPVTFPEFEVSRWERRVRAIRREGTMDIPSTPSWKYWPKSGGTLSYSHTALWLETLRRRLGEATLREILSTFFERYSFRHPRPDDFFAVAEEVAGQELDWFFDQVYRDAVVFDYGIARVKSVSAALEGWYESEGGGLVYAAPEAQDDETDDDQVYRNEVVVRRYGAGRFPVDVRMVFEDGHEIRESWDGQARWKMYVVERPSKLKLAEVDPDRVLMLDARQRNNSRLREPEAALPAVKWGSKWMIWFQDMLSTLAFFI